MAEPATEADAGPRVALKLTCATLGLALALALAAVGCHRSPAAPPPASVILILVDTLRADHLGAYGYPRPTSPAIDRLAAESLLFRQARTVAPWTNPTIAALFLGRRPTAISEPKPYGQAVNEVLPKELPTLAERLQAAGLRTAALVDHPGISPARGYARGFDSFVRLYAAAKTSVWSPTDADFITAQLDEELSAHAAARFFVYVHLVYPHRPYSPPPPYDAMFGEITDKTSRELREQMINAYDAEIRFTDAVVEDLLAVLARHRRLDDAWVVLTSDHGEGFWEHGREEHGNTLYDELLLVPLIVRPPKGSGIEPRIVEAPVSLLDLHSTVLEAAAGDRLRDEEIRRRSLLRHLDRGRSATFDDVVSQQQHTGDVNAASIVRGTWKLIRREARRKGKLELFDLNRDPGELHDVRKAQNETARRLDRALLQAIARDNRDRARLAERAPNPLDEDEIARLRALGYLQ